MGLLASWTNMCQVTAQNTHQNQSDCNLHLNCSVHPVDMVPNASDDERRYAFRKQVGCTVFKHIRTLIIHCAIQPDVGHFNLEKLMKALTPLLSASAAQ